MYSLENKVAIVTGAAAGLGKEIVKLYIQAGAKVLATDYNSETLNNLENEINNSNLKVLLSDVSKSEDVKKMFEVAIADFGGLDILVNNAGVMDNFEPIGDVEDSTWNRIMNINVKGTFEAMREAIKIFEPKQKGVIINVSSIGGLQGARAGAAYTASKHAVMGLTKNTGYLYSKKGIRCNAIAPGGMNTSILSTLDMNNVSDLSKEMILGPSASNPRSSEPIEVAHVALFLASDEASFVNGAIITADGGWTAY
jgi:NAD(P)-dependent dehydrogenase (short-subunit alcohol dehydrogenase family)